MAPTASIAGEELQDIAEEFEEYQEAAELKFGLEKDLHRAVRAHIDQLDPDFRIVDEGKERHVESGFIDILAQDGNGRLVVIELKIGPAPNDVITQILGYIGDLTAEGERDVTGVVIAEEFSTRVRSAARVAGLRLVTYSYQFTFADA
jgi:RecB family endonuclease NucS